MSDKITLTKAQARHYPEFRFGSPELSRVHTSRKDWRGYYTDNFTYIVDHGHFKTLNTITYGYRGPHIQDLEIVE